MPDSILQTDLNRKSLFKATPAGAFQVASVSLAKIQVAPPNNAANNKNQYFLFITNKYYIVLLSISYEGI